MEKPSILLFGASGHVGRAVAAEAKRRGWHVVAVIRNRHRGKQLVDITDRRVTADVSRPADLTGLCDGHSVVLSAVGKSVSPFERSKPSFQDIDFRANLNILKEAQRAGVGKFVYVSAFHAERYPALEYFRAHHAFTERLIGSGLDYSVVKPPALFSAFIDLIDMAQKGMLVNLGDGKARTNPIWEGDVAKVCLDAVGLRNVTVEAGGPEVMSRAEINALIQRLARPGKRVRNVPLGLVKSLLPVMKRLDRNTYDKVAFMATVTQTDTIAPIVGTKRLEEYVKEQLGG